MDAFSRQQKLIGKNGMKQLLSAHVAVFGIGGVGGYVAEALARTGIGRITLVDKDNVDTTNLNRQLVALESTIGLAKVDIMKARIEHINPQCVVTAKKVFVMPDNVDTLLEGITYAIDAVDNVTAKLAIITTCQKKGISVISSMGAGNRMAGDFQVMDIYETSNDALARVMRRELKKRGVEKQKVVCTNEKPMCMLEKGEAILSISYMPGLCGLTIAGEVVREIIRSNHG